MQAQPSVFHPVLGPCSMSRLAWLEDIDITSSHQCSCHALPVQVQCTCCQGNSCSIDADLQVMLK